MESTFRGGKFEQDIQLVAPQSLQIRPEESTTTESKTVETNGDAVSEEISKEAGEGIVSGQIGAYDGS